MGKHLNGESASFRASFIEREQKKLNVAFLCFSWKNEKVSNLCLFACKGYSFSPFILVRHGKPVSLLSILVSLSLNLRESFSIMSNYMIHLILEDIGMCLNINVLEYPS